MNRKTRRRELKRTKRRCYQEGHPRLSDDGVHCLCTFMATLDAEEFKEFCDEVEMAEMALAEEHRKASNS